MRFISVISIFISLYSHAAPISEGQYRGNGADELRVIFSDARTEARKRLFALDECSLPEDASSEDREWILKNKILLANDIRDSRHEWIEEEQLTCARTQTTAKAPIYFSFKDCDEQKIDLSIATQILLHESIHHFGISDENHTQNLAQIIWNAQEQNSCPTKNDPFNPNSCLGSSLRTQEALQLLAGEKLKHLGPFKIQVRKRSCFYASCSNWKEIKPEDPDFLNIQPGFDVGFQNLPINPEGSVQFKLVDGEPKLVLEGYSSSMSLNHESFEQPSSLSYHFFFENSADFNKEHIKDKNLACSVESSKKASYQSPLYFQSLKTPVQFDSGVITNKCVRLTSHSKYLLYQNGKVLRFELEAVLLGWIY